MKQLNYLLGLLNITAPKTVKSHKDSFGNCIDVVDMTKPIQLKTILPQGVDTWENITPKMCNTWIRSMNVGKLYSRIEVSPTSDKIVNKNKLVLTEQIRY